MSESEDEDEMRVNCYASQSQVMEGFSDEEDAVELEDGLVGNVDAVTSARSVGSAWTDLKTSVVGFLSAVAVNMFVMDSCAKGEDDELRGKAKNVSKWVEHMKTIDDGFPAYEQYR